MRVSIIRAREKLPPGEYIQSHDVNFFSFPFVIKSEAGAIVSGTGSFTSGVVCLATLQGVHTSFLVALAYEAGGVTYGVGGHASMSGAAASCAGGEAYEVGNETSCHGVEDSHLHFHDNLAKLFKFRHKKPHF